MAKILGIVGVLVGLGIVFVQTAQVELARHQVNNEGEIIALLERLSHQQAALAESLRDLQKRVDDLESRVPRKNDFEKINHVADIGSSVPSINPIGSGASTRTFYLKEYILPGIYILLGLILFVASVVSLSSKSPPKTAVETTKTLITFFIGVTTGQV
jgi:hypothetical protein